MGTLGISSISIEIWNNALNIINGNYCAVQWEGGTLGLTSMEMRNIGFINNGNREHWA